MVPNVTKAQLSELVVAPSNALAALCDCQRVAVATGYLDDSRLGQVVQRETTGRPDVLRLT